MTSLSSNNYCVLDFETRSSCDIKKGAWFYANNPSTEPTVLGIKFKDTPPKAIVGIDNITRMCYKLLKFSKKYPLICYNLDFDFLIFKKLTNCDITEFSKWIDVRLLCCFNGSKIKSLDDNLRFFKVDDRKDAFGKSLVKILCQPHDKNLKKTFSGETLLFDKKGYVVNSKLYARFVEYCKKDVEVTEKLYLKLKKHSGEVRESSKEDIYLNLFRNAKGVKLDTSLLKLMLKEIDKITTLCKQKASQICNISLSSDIQLIRYFKSKGVNLLNTERKYLLKQKLEGDLKSLILLKCALPRGEGSKVKTALSNSVKGVLRDNFIYYGAGRTGRYISKGFNILNLPRGDIENFDKKLNLLKEGSFINTYGLGSNQELMSMIRHSIIPHNDIFYGADFKNIDFRLLLLTAKEFPFLRKVFKGLDVYKMFACMVFGKNEKDITSEERYLCKKVVLSAGYGVGVDRMKEVIYLESGKVTSRHFIEEVRNIYHKTFPNVKKVWKKLEGDFEVSGFLTTPYFKQRVVLEHFLDKSTLWGGKLTGILIQTMTQNLLNFTTRQLYLKMGQNTLIPFHDAVVIDVKKEVSYDKFKKVVSLTPSFFPSEFPEVQCETWKDVRFK